MEPTFEEALERLKEVVRQLEKGEATLEESLKLFEEGISLVRICNSQLEKAEAKIRILVGADGDKPELVPFEPGAGTEHRRD